MLLQSRQPASRRRLRRVNRRLVRLRRFAPLPGAPFERLDFQRHAKINVDPFVRVRMPTGKRHGGFPAVFGYAQFEVLVVWRRRSGMPSGQVMMFKSDVKSLIGFRDDADDI